MEIIMPKMGDAMTEGKVIRWYKKEGEAVKKGDPLLEIETDKVNLDLEAEQDGGPQGRIVARDVKEFGSGAAAFRPPIGGLKPAAPQQTLEEKSIPLSTMRRTIAKRLA